MLLILGLGLTIASIVLNIISLALPYWYYGSHDDNTFYFGLFKVCASSSHASHCSSFGDGGWLLNATKGLMILGFIILLTAVICLMLKQNKKIGAICACLAGGFMMVGAIIFTTESGLKRLGDRMNIPELSLHAGFAFAILSAIAAIAAGVLLVLNLRQVTENE